VGATERLTSPIASRQPLNYSRNTAFIVCTIELVPTRYERGSTLVCWLSIYVNQLIHGWQHAHEFWCSPFHNGWFSALTEHFVDRRWYVHTTVVVEHITHATFIIYHTCSFTFWFSSVGSHQSTLTHSIHSSDYVWELCREHDGERFASL
jgi:hypothetical protein